MAQFNDVVKPPKPTEEEKLKEATKSAQEQLFDRLSKEAVDNTYDKICEFAPQDEYTIAGEKYQRKQIKPRDNVLIKKAEKEFLNAVEQKMDIDVVEERKINVLFVKANIYLGMTEKQFEDTDAELLAMILQATELRSQGFRKR